jgi:hypothetical protein
MEELKRMYVLASQVKENITVNEAKKIINRLELFYNETKDLYDPYFMQTLDKIEEIDLRCSLGLPLFHMIIRSFVGRYETYYNINQTNIGEIETDLCKDKDTVS